MSGGALERVFREASGRIVGALAISAASVKQARHLPSLPRIPEVDNWGFPVNIGTNPLFSIELPSEGARPGSACK